MSSNAYKPAPNIMRTLTTTAFAVLTLLVGSASAQTVQSTVLSDKIYKGSGTIDLLKDVSAANLNSYFGQNYRMLLLGADLNEDNAGNESKASVGIAIKQAQLSITTTQGNFTFNDFFTNTTSALKESGSKTAAPYYTMFGQGGSSQITGTGPVDISKFDDVMWFENINYTGDIVSAKLNVQFLDVGATKPSDKTSESFFDFSGGFEDFALFSKADAALLEAAAIGVAGAPAGITFAQSSQNVITALAAAEAAANNNNGGNGTGDTGGGSNTGGGTGGTGGDTGGSGGVVDSGGGTGGTGDTGGGSNTGGGTGGTGGTGNTGGDTGGTGDAGGGIGGPATPAAPAPPFLIAVLVGALLLWKNRRVESAGNA